MNVNEYTWVMPARIPITRAEIVEVVGGAKGQVEAVKRVRGRWPALGAAQTSWLVADAKERGYIFKEPPDFRVGDLVRVHKSDKSLPHQDTFGVVVEKLSNTVTVFFGGWSHGHDGGYRYEELRHCWSFFHNVEESESNSIHNLKLLASRR